MLLLIRRIGRLVSYIKNKTLFRGEWYFSNLPFYIIDVPLISYWYSKEAKYIITPQPLAPAWDQGEDVKLFITLTCPGYKAIFVYNPNK